MTLHFPETAGDALNDGHDRPTRPALIRGWQCLCPNCGKGALLHHYLKVTEKCAACGTDFTPQRADDGPAYMTILVVGHIVTPLLYFVFVTYRPTPIYMAFGFSALTIVLALLLLPRFKGMFVALQWAKRMHGFGSGPEPVLD